MVPAAPNCPYYQARGGFDYFQKTEDDVIEEKGVVSGEEEPSLKQNFSKSFQPASENQRNPLER